MLDYTTNNVILYNICLSTSIDGAHHIKFININENLFFINKYNCYCKNMKAIFYWKIFYFRTYRDHIHRILTVKIMFECLEKKGQSSK